MTRQLTFDFPHRPALGGADFLVAPSNAEAVAWVDRWPAWPASTLVVCGPPGCGKTHLAHVWRARCGAEPLAATALQPAEPPGATAILVDDAERAPERPLLHLVNIMAERGGHLLLTAGAPPARWRLDLPDLRSRLLAAPLATLQPPDDALLAAILVKLFADRQLRVGEEVIAFLLRQMERSGAAARRIVASLDRAALEGQRRVTVPLVRAVLDREGTESPN